CFRVLSGHQERREQQLRWNERETVGRHNTRRWLSAMFPSGGVCQKDFEETHGGGEIQHTKRGPNNRHTHTARERERERELAIVTAAGSPEQSLRGVIQMQ